METKSDRGQATRTHIVTAATELFTEHGYEATSIELILRTCGISRGALYHHFSSKEAVFTAVLEAVEARVAATVAGAAAHAANPLDALRAGSVAWLGLATDPTVRRIVLLDAPTAVGWQAWREIDSRNALGLLKAALGMIAAAGRFSPDLVDVYAHMLVAVLTEVALLIARADDVPATIEKGRRAIEVLLSGIARVEPDGAW
jgi:AcrR family transcriptional regulator